jgi:ATP-binding cassette subfamily B protein
MVKVIRRFFDFCGAANRKKFVTSIWLGVLLALFEALKIPAIAVMMRAMLPV